MVLKESSSRGLFLGIALATFFSFSVFLSALFVIGTYPIGGSSEAREAHIARIIFETGEWVLPLRNGIIPSKPPMFHWLTAGLGMIQGAVGEGTARLTSLIAGTAIMFITIFLVLRVANRAETQANFGLASLCALVLGTTYGFTSMMIDARVDMLFSFFVLLALAPAFYGLSFENSPENPKSRPLNDLQMTLFFIGCGGAVLTKGPLGLALPLMVIGLSCWCSVGFVSACKFLLRPRASWLIFVLIAVPWYVAAWQRGGEAFINRQLFFENLERLSGGEQVNTEAFWYYVPAFLRTAFPWSIIVLILLQRLVSRTRGFGISGPFKTPLHRLGIFGGLWFVAGFLLFSLASGKRSSYLLPLYPGLALFIVAFLPDYIDSFSDRSRGIIRLFSAGVMRFLPLLCLALILGFEAARLPWEIKTVAESLSIHWLHLYSRHFQIVLIILLSIWLILARLRPAWNELYAVPLVAGLVLLITCAGLGVKNYLKQFPEMARTLDLQLAEERGPLQILKVRTDELFDPLMFYLHTPVVVSDPGRINEACSSSMLMRSEAYAERKKVSSELTLSIIQKFSSPVDAAKGHKEKEFVLFSCSPSST